MKQRESTVLESGRRVGLALAEFEAELDDFEPLKEANSARAALVEAIEQKASVQSQDTDWATLSKEELREQLAQTAATLSDRAVAYALSVGDLGLKQALTLTYSDVRYGDADEDLAHVRALVARVRALGCDLPIIPGIMPVTRISQIERFADLSGAALSTLTHDHAAGAWKARGFYRMLDAMLFRAAEPGERYRVLERFYGLDARLIARFYAGRSTLGDKARVLMGKPPVPVGRAIRAIRGARA